MIYSFHSFRSSSTQSSCLPPARCYPWTMMTLSVAATWECFLLTMNHGDTHLVVFFTPLRGTLHKNTQSIKPHRHQLDIHEVNSAVVEWRLTHQLFEVSYLLNILRCCKTVHQSIIEGAPTNTFSSITRRPARSRCSQMRGYPHLDLRLFVCFCAIVALS